MAKVYEDDFGAEFDAAPESRNDAPVSGTVKKEDTPELAAQKADIETSEREHSAAWDAAVAEGAKDEKALKPADAPKPAEAPKQMSFKEKFASERAAGNANFEWNGKKYTTELAKKKSAETKTELSRAETKPLATSQVDVAKEPVKSVMATKPPEMQSTSKVDWKGKPVMEPVVKKAAPMAAPDAPNTDVAIAPVGKRYFGNDGKPLAPTAASVFTKPAVKKSSSPMR